MTEFRVTRPIRLALTGSVTSNAPSGIVITSAPPPPAPSPDPANWASRSTGASVVWSHNFDADAEVTNHMQTPDPVACPVPLRRVVDESGIGCLEQIALGATLSAAYTAGSSTMQINDATYWPNPAVTGSFYFYVSDPAPTVGNKNAFLCTARSGTTLTVTYYSLAGVSAFASTPQSYAVGAYAGNEAGDWRRTFAALPAGENGRGVDDLGASGTVPLRSKVSGNSYSVPRDSAFWQYGWYGHSSNQATWSDWTPWSGTTTYTPRGVSQGAAAKYRLWDGNEFFIQFRMKIDPRFWALNVLPSPSSEDSYFGRKGWALQSEVSSTNQLVTGFGPSNRYNIPATPENPFSLNTYKAARVIGVSDYPSRPHVSHQLGSPWDVAPYYANLTTSFLPASGLATPDGAAAWEFKGGEWITFLIRVKPGRSNVAETEIDVKFARTENLSYDGTYTTLLSVTDARIVYSGSGDYDFPDGAFSYPAVQVMNALPGFQSFGIMGYFNGFQTAGIPPPMASYYVRMAQVIFSKATIAPPTIDVLPTWVPAAGNVAELTQANGKLANRFSDTCNSYYSTFYHWYCVQGDSGMVANPHWGKWGAKISFGGGHASTNNNQVTAVVYGDTSISFKRLTNAAPIFGTSGSGILWNDGYDEPTHQVSINEDARYVIAGHTLLEPAGPHSYGALDVVGPANGGAANGTFLVTTIAAPGHRGNTNAGAGGARSVQQIAFDTSTGVDGSYVWTEPTTNKGPIPVGGPAWTQYVPAQDKVYGFSRDSNPARPVSVFNRATNTWSTGSNTVATNSDGPYTGILIHVPARDLLIFADRYLGNMRIQYASVPSGGTSDPVWGVATLSATVAAPLGWSSLTWCTHSSELVAGCLDNSSVTYITIPGSLSGTWTAERVVFPGGQTIYVPDNTGVASGSPSYKKWSYDEKVRCIVFPAKILRPDLGPDSVHVFRPRGT